MAAEGKRNTRQRDVIVDIFFERGVDGHLSLQELLDLVQEVEPGVGFATVYRTMKLLTDAEVAHERRFVEGQTRYELADFGEHHDHLICTRCGHILEFEDPTIERRQREIASDLGVRITHHRHEIYGVCVDLDACNRRLESASA
ncbi:MAG: transcriptional repressor [Alphaproteobacteria bacterium]|nr:transcriptional repressor [Alphaproteobacteria bacterium]